MDWKTPSSSGAGPIRKAVKAMTFDQPDRKEPRNHPPAVALPWMAPPENELGEPVPARLFLVRTNRLVIAITERLVYGTGFDFHAAARMPAADPQELADRAPKPGRFDADEPPPHDVLQFSVTFADGRQGLSLNTPLNSKLAWRGKPAVRTRGVHHKADQSAEGFPEKSRPP